MDEPAMLALWAKLPRHDPGSTDYHPLVCHLIDAAEVALAMWRDVLPPAVTSRVAERLEMSESDAARWLAFIVALHDLGKAYPGFADLPGPCHWRLVASGFSIPSFPQREHHGLVSAFVVRRLLSDCGLSIRLANTVATMVGGHHGMLNPPPHLPMTLLGGVHWDDARRAMFDHLHGCYVGDCAAPARLDIATATWLAGMISVSDWIASSEEHFPFAVRDGLMIKDLDLNVYRQEAADRATQALETLGWRGWPSDSNPRSFVSLFPKIGELGLRPVQSEAIALADGLVPPCLVIIEAPMGEGKTEAAMYLADRWGALHGQRGCYFALPTQATSDQMFSRIHDFLTRRFPGEVVNLQLQHGHSALSAEFALLRARGDRLFVPTGVSASYRLDGNPHDDARDENAGVVSAGWFTRGKRGLLAPFGVGTVDQCMLAALSARHCFVRLFGLGSKVVIIDEVHAYDTYMSGILDRLVEWLAALGTSVVMLSATLPKARQEGLIGAFRKGLVACRQEAAEERRDTVASPAPYPRISWIDARGEDSKHVPASAALSRDLHLRWIPLQVPEIAETRYELGEALRETLKNGGCAAVICNTVQRAQETYRALLPYFPGVADDGLPELTLLHARYPYFERHRREQGALVRFGPRGSSVQLDDGPVPTLRPNRAVLVSTQIIEQSLDLDFDLMVSDLAPMDLILQRSGRLHRHLRQRPDALSTPTLWVGCPSIDENALPVFDRGSERVYEEHILLRTWFVLQGKSTIAVPGEVEDLIEAVYDDRACPDGCPVALKQRWNTSLAKRLDVVKKDEQEAANRWLRPPSSNLSLWDIMRDDLEEDSPEFHSSRQALTRLSDPTAEVALLYGDSSCPRLASSDPRTVNTTTKLTVGEAKEVLQRSLKISHRGVVPELWKIEVPSGWRLSPLVRNHRLLILDENDSVPVGKYTLRLDPDLGLIVNRD